MIQTHDLSGVLDQDLCIACGACVQVDDSLELRLHPDKQIFEPIHASNADAASVCPAVQVDFERLHAEVFPGAEVGPYGVVESVWLAQSRDLDRNMKASSGGMIKEMLLALLARDDCAGVLALDRGEGLQYRPRIITDPDEIDRMPGSIYHNLPKDDVIPLLRAAPGKVVMVGIPCEFEGTFQYISKFEPELRDKIHTTIGLLCGWQYNYHALRAICEYKGIDYDALTDVTYRGGGPVGKLQLHTDQETHTVGRRVDYSYQVAFDRTFNTARCHLCINHANFLADIVVGDAWLPSTVSTRTGISLVIMRTAAGEQLLRHLAEEDRLVATEVTTAEIEESQTHRIAMGDFAYAYAEFLDELGLHRPDMVGPNRVETRPVSREEVASFHAELRTKTALQRARRYGYLRLRKGTKEFKRYSWRYLRWFGVRILKLKSLTGQREEVSSAQLRDFR
jgi:coenzyme F420-reducing hydrogenase beta subunit